MQKGTINIRIFSIVFLTLLLLGQSALAAYNDPQERFSLEPPEGWKVQGGTGLAVFTDPDGATSLIVLPGEFSESTTLNEISSVYEKILKEARPDTAVEVVKETKIEIAGHPALQKEYALKGERGKSGRILAAFVKKGTLSITFAATVSEAEYGDVKPVLQSFFQSLRFPKAVSEAIILTPSIQKKIELRETQKNSLVIISHLGEVLPP